MRSILLFLCILTISSCGGGGDNTTTSALKVGNPKYPISYPPIWVSDSSIPSNPQATGGLGQMSITWGPVESAINYNLYWSAAPNLTKAADCITGVASPYVQAGLDANKTYYYIVVPVFEGGEGFPSVEFSGVTK